MSESTPLIDRILLDHFIRDFGERLRAGDAHRNRYPGKAPHGFADLVPVGMQLFPWYMRQVQKGFIDRVDFDTWGKGRQCLHHAIGHIGI